jgi:TolA-binding protein
VSLRRLIAGVLAAALLPALVSASSPEELERRCKAFYEQLARGRTTQAKDEWRGLEREVGAKVAELQDRLDSMREAVVDQNGSLESLYQSSRWRDAEIPAMVLQYHLAWVRYQGAQLTDDKNEKNRLLRRAVEGFSQFTIVPDAPEIYAESLYGRGLAFMDLGHYQSAIADFDAASRDRRTAGKANAALAEARRRAAGGKTPKAPDPATQLDRLATLLADADRSAARATEATELARGLAAQGGDWPKRVEQVVADTLGDGTRASGHSSYGLLLLGQLSLDRNRCSDLRALADAGAQVRDGGRGTYRPELLFMYAGCRLNGGHPAEAAALFEALEREFPNSARSQDAAYYRFRALDTARAADPSLDGAYREAAHAFAARWPKTTRADEARYLLAEDLRAAGSCDEATALYEQIGGTFAARAGLGTLECRVSRLGADTPETERAAVLRDLMTYAEKTSAKDAPSQVARASLLAALVAASSKPADYDATAAMLDDYEKRFPAQDEWHAMARQTRLEALLALGRLGDAEADALRVLEAPLTPESTRLLTRLGNDLVAQADRTPAGDPGGERTATLARSIFAKLAEKSGSVTDRLVLADLELRTGEAAEALRVYEQILAEEPGSAQARRGAARAAETLGNHAAALGHWRAVIESSTPGGTAWYEARLNQIDVMVADGQTDMACDLLRRSLGQATTTGGDALEAQLRARQPELCP